MAIGSLFETVQRESSGHLIFPPITEMVFPCVTSPYNSIVKRSHALRKRLEVLCCQKTLRYLPVSSDTMAWYTTDYTAEQNLVKLDFNVNRKYG